MLADRRVRGGGADAVAPAMRAGGHGRGQRRASSVWPVPRTSARAGAGAAAAPESGREQSEEQHRGGERVDEPVEVAIALGLTQAPLQRPNVCCWRGESLRSRATLGLERLQRSCAAPPMRLRARPHSRGEAISSVAGSALLDCVCGADGVRRRRPRRRRDKAAARMDAARRRRARRRGAGGAARATEGSRALTASPAVPTCAPPAARTATPSTERGAAERRAARCAWARRGSSARRGAPSPAPRRRGARRVAA